MQSQEAFGRSDSALAGYIYDKDRVQGYDWLNTVDPTSFFVIRNYQLQTRISPLAGNKRSIKNIFS